jgi:hypothetical protein
MDGARRVSWDSELFISGCDLQRKQLMMLRMTAARGLRITAGTGDDCWERDDRCGQVSELAERRGEGGNWDETSVT